MPTHPALIDLAHRQDEVRADGLLDQALALPIVNQNVRRVVAAVVRRRAGVELGRALGGLQPGISTGMTLHPQDAHGCCRLRSKPKM